MKREGDRVYDLEARESTMGRSPERAGVWELKAISVSYSCTGARTKHEYIFLCCLVLFCCNLDAILQIEVLDMRGS